MSVFPSCRLSQGDAIVESSSWRLATTTQGLASATRIPLVLPLAHAHICSLETFILLGQLMWLVDKRAGVLADPLPGSRKLHF